MEPSHQILGWIVVVLAIAIAFGLAKIEKRAWLRLLGWVTLGVVVVEALLGLNPILVMSPAVSIFHATLAHIFFAATVAIAVFTSPGWMSGPEMVSDRGWPPLRPMAIATPILVLLQVMLGVAFRHKEMGVMPHILGALVVALVVVLVSVCVMQQFPAHRSLYPAAVALIIITGVQVFLGLTVYIILLMSAGAVPVLASSVAHVTTGALTLAASVVLGIQIRRNVREFALPEAAPTTSAVTS